MNNQPKNETAATPRQPEPQTQPTCNVAVNHFVQHLRLRDVAQSRSGNVDAALATLATDWIDQYPELDTESSASLSEWYDWVERNQRENQRQEEDLRQWAHDQSQAAVDDWYEGGSEVLREGTS